MSRKIRIEIELSSWLGSAAALKCRLSYSSGTGATRVLTTDEATMLSLDWAKLTRADVSGFHLITSSLSDGEFGRGSRCVPSQSPF